MLAPERLVYGHEIAGRQADLHAVVSQLSNAKGSELLAQAATIGPGWALARAMSPVSALNAIILWTFPLTAIATFALARYLHRSNLGAIVAALAFSFSPLHLAQAAYHPYTAQLQWLPLYLLALIALVDRATMLRAAAYVAASTVLFLSNYEAALIAAFITPIVIVAFWAIRPDLLEDYRPLIWPFAMFAALLAGAVAIALVRDPSVFSSAYARQFPIEEIGLYRARWWAYFTPAVDHPVLGGTAWDVFGRQGVNLVLEQQIFLGIALTVLAVIAFGVSAWTWRPEWRYVVAIIAVGLTAAIVSIGPATGTCKPFSLAPGCLAFRVVPVFRTYARFAVAANLAIAIAAGAGAAMLFERSRAGKTAAMALLAVAIFEFWPLPARAHDVLPTAAHRWLASLPSTVRALDCYPANQADRFVPWLMHRELVFLGHDVRTCSDPELGQKLAALGYTHLVVRGGEASSKLVQPLPVGIATAHEFADSHVYTVAATVPPVVIVSTTGFYDYEHQEGDWWRWMSANGQWTIRNTTAAPQRVTLVVDLVPIGAPRTLTATLGRETATTVPLAMARREYAIGPWTLAPGDHTLTFAADGEPTRPSDLIDNSKDIRPLTVAFRNVHWNAQ